MGFEKRLPTVLIIGNSDLAGNMADTLSTQELKVISAPSEVEALRSINLKKPDIIIMLMDSYQSSKEMLRIIKSNNDFTLIPILVVHSFNNTQEKMEVFEAGAFDCIDVPFVMNEFIIKLKSYLNLYMLCLDLKNQNQVLRDIAVIDEVTGLFNKRYFMGRVTSEVSRAVRMGEDLSFVIISLDEFDDIEKVYGNDAKDFVIKQMAFALKETVRLSDILIRYREDELAVLCPMTDASGIETFVEKVRKKIERTSFDYKDAKIRTTVSMGVYTLTTSDFNKVENKIHNIVNFAEKALEKAKLKEENKIEFYEI